MLVCFVILSWVFSLVMSEQAHLFQQGACLCLFVYTVFVFLTGMFYFHSQVCCVFVICFCYLCVACLFGFLFCFLFRASRVVYVFGLSGFVFLFICFVWVVFVVVFLSWVFLLYV